MERLQFEPLVDRLNPGKKGVAEIKHIEISEKESSFTSIRAMVTRKDEYVAPGTYTQLLINGKIMMSDTSMEKRTNRDLLYQAHGHVLVAGLGIGMVLLPLLKSGKIESVTVVEKYQEVIDLVSPSFAEFGDKLKIVCADIFEWKPEKGTKYNTIYFDIWPTITTDNLPEMATLHRRFAKCKAEGGWMGSWCKQELLSRKRGENREAKRWRFSW